MPSCLIRVSGFAWAEIFYERRERKDRYQRVELISATLPKVARIGEWIRRRHAGHDSSVESVRTSRRASKPDREQFLSFAAQTNDDFI